MRADARADAREPLIGSHRSHGMRVDARADAGADASPPICHVTSLNQSDLLKLERICSRESAPASAPASAPICHVTSLNQLDLLKLERIRSRESALASAPICDGRSVTDLPIHHKFMGADSRERMHESGLIIGY